MICEKGPSCLVLYSGSLFPFSDHESTLLIPQFHLPLNLFVSIAFYGAAGFLWLELLFHLLPKSTSLYSFLPSCSHADSSF